MQYFNVYKLYWQKITSHTFCSSCTRSSLSKAASEKCSYSRNLLSHFLCSSPQQKSTRYVEIIQIRNIKRIYLTQIFPFTTAPLFKACRLLWKHHVFSILSNIFIKWNRNQNQNPGEVCHTHKLQSQWKAENYKDRLSVVLLTGKKLSSVLVPFQKAILP